MRIKRNDFKEIRKYISNKPNDADKLHIMSILYETERYFQQDQIHRNELRRKKNIKNKTYRKLKHPRQPIHAKLSYEDSVINYVNRREQNAKYERGEL